MQKIEELIRKYNSGTCSEEEKILLEQWYQSFEWTDINKEISGLEKDKLKEEVWLYLQNKHLSDPVHQLIPTHASHHYFPWKYAAAIFIVGILGYGIYFFQIDGHSEKETLSIESTVKPEVMPGSSKAELTLGDGNVISLDSAGVMQLTEADGTQIEKKQGNLIYASANTEDDKILFNTLSTPRGGEYHVVLPDGTHVWLNSASSLKFPTSFKGKERTVFLKGEAYFEVAQNSEFPFMVKLDNELTVKVLGTHFNIMAYGDEEEVKTTLVEGKVSVISETQTVDLTPAEQAVLNKNDQNMFVQAADISGELAWKTGTIELSGRDVPFIMRQISRWYDVDIIFEGNVPEGKYSGTIRKKVQLSKVLEILKLTGVECKIENRTLIVSGT